jgi:hypothetical protein
VLEYMFYPAVFFFIQSFNEFTCHPDSAMYVYHMSQWLMGFVAILLPLWNLVSSFKRDSARKMRACFSRVTFIAAVMVFLLMVFSAFPYFSPKNDCITSAPLVNFALRLLVVGFVVWGVFLLCMCIIAVKLTKLAKNDEWVNSLVIDDEEEKDPKNYKEVKKEKRIIL